MSAILCPLPRVPRASCVAAALLLASVAAAAQSPAPARQQALITMLRQDCGSCHGMRLTGGLGPALTPQALAELPTVNVAATIYHGRPGTPMPPWSAMLTEAEAQWLAEQLRAGLPPLASAGGSR